MALTAGITSGIGNFFLGVKLSHAGALGPGFTGPLGFVGLLVYRTFTFLRTKHRSGTYVDKAKSNFY